MAVHPSGRSQVRSGRGDRMVWQVTSQTSGALQPTIERFDFVVNAAGYQTGKIDDMVLAAIGKVAAVPSQVAVPEAAMPERMVEFKAAYMTKWPGLEDK